MQRIFLVLLMSSWTFCLAQTTFEKTYGSFSSNEYGYDVVQLADSSYLMAGQALDSLRILKFSSEGNLIWNHGVDRITQQYLYKQNENSFYITQTGDIRKIDSLGNSQWFSSYIANNLNARLNPTHDLGFVCTGNVYNPLLNYHKVGIFKFDSSSTLLSADTIMIDTVYRYWILGIKELSDNNFIVAASKDSNTIALGYEFIKIDTSGNIVWRKSIADDSITIKEMIAISDTGFVISGMNPSNNFQLFLKRFDVNGNMVGNYTYINSCAIYRFQIRQTSDKGFIIGCDAGCGGTDLLILKTDSSGNQQWYRTFGSSHFDYFGSVSETLDHGYIICGTKYLIGNNMDYYLIKLDSLGFVDSTLTNTFNFPSSKVEIKISPNPSHQFIFLSGKKLQSGLAEIIITDMIGQLVFSKKENVYGDGILSSTINLEGITCGIYFVRISDGVNYVLEKLVIE